MVHTYTLANGKQVKVTAKNKRVAKKFLGAEHYAYTILIEVDGSDVTYKTTFHDSIRNYQLGKGASEELIDNGIYSIILDADSYNANPDVREFCDEFGYEEDEGKKVYEACKKAYDALSAMLTEEEIDSLYHEAYEKKYEN